MEKEYIELFVSEPYWDYQKGKWTAWTSGSPQKGGYKVRIPVPSELLSKRMEDAEIVKD